MAAQGIVSVFTIIPITIYSRYIITHRSMVIIAFLTKLFVTIIGIASGAIILQYRKIVYEWTGRFAWAEEYLGSGGTIVVISLAGFLLIVMSIAYLFGAFDHTDATGVVSRMYIGPNAPASATSPTK